MADAGIDLRIADAIKKLLIKVIHAVDHRAAYGAVDPRGVFEVEHGVTAGAQRDRRMLGGEEAGRPQSIRKRLDIYLDRHLRDHDHEGGQFIVDGAESVREPSSDRRFARKHIPRGDRENRRLVINGFRVQ